MATDILVSDGAPTVIPKALVDIALEASWELESLMEHLAHQCSDPDNYAFRGMALRAVQLNNVLMDVLAYTDKCKPRVLERTVLGAVASKTRAQVAEEVRHG